MKIEVKFLIWIILLTLASVSFANNEDNRIISNCNELKGIETFTFSSNGNNIKGKIYLPASYKTNNNLPAIYLIDYKESHFKVATDEFEQVIKSVQKIVGFEALVVTLEEHFHIDTTPENFEEHYIIFKNMATYVDNTYTNNTSRTFIGRGSEAGVVLMSLLFENSVFNNFIATGSPGYFNKTMIKMLQNDDFPIDMKNKKLHFSFAADPQKHHWTELNNLIKEKQYTWLKYQSIEYPNQTFVNVYPLAFSSGIRYVFDK